MRNRMGRFTIPNTVIADVVNGDHDALAKWSALFGKCVVLETTRRFDSDSTEYLVCCADFEPLPHAINAPRYAVEFTSVADHFAGASVVAYEAKFRRVAA